MTIWSYKETPQKLLMTHFQTSDASLPPVTWLYLDILQPAQFYRPHGHLTILQWFYQKVAFIFSFQQKKQPIANNGVS